MARDVSPFCNSSISSVFNFWSTCSSLSMARNPVVTHFGTLYFSLSILPESHFESTSHTSLTIPAFSATSREPASSCRIKARTCNRAESRLFFVSSKTGQQSLIRLRRQDITPDRCSPLFSEHINTSKSLTGKARGSFICRSFVHVVISSSTGGSETISASICSRVSSTTFSFVSDSEFPRDIARARASSSSSWISSGWENSHSMANSTLFDPTCLKASSALDLENPISTIVEMVVSLGGGPVTRALLLPAKLFSSTPEYTCLMMEMRAVTKS